VHRRNKTQAILNPTPPHNRLYQRSDVNHLIPLVRIERQILRVRLHSCHSNTPVTKPVASHCWIYTCPMPAHATSQALLLSAARLRRILKQQKSKLQSGNNRSREASTLPIETSNGVGMKKTLHALAAIVCLLTLLVGSVSCLHIAAQQQATCNHCPKHSPLSKNTPSCCSTPQPTQAALVSAELQQPTHPSTAPLPLLTDFKAQSLALSLTQFSQPPPLPPRITLRI
jgi:hypothetical protein